MNTSITNLNKTIDYYNCISGAEISAIVTYTYPVWSDIFNKVLLLKAEIYIYGEYSDIEIYLNESNKPIVSTKHLTDNEGSTIMLYYFSEERHILDLMKTHKLPTMETMEAHNIAYNTIEKGN